MTNKERRQARYVRRQYKRQLKKKAANFEYDYFDTVFSYKNLYRAYEKCRCGVSWKSSVQKFITQAPLEVYRIYERLRAEAWKSKGFFEFTVLERGKVRSIKSVTIDERVVQCCLCTNALIPVIGRTMIYDNGASVKDKGYHFAINRCVKHLHDHYREHGRDGYVLIFDFSKFFDNVNHAVIRNIMESNFDDVKIKRLTMYLVNMFGDVGLGLGSQISQIFALASANRLDHSIKEDMHIHGYGRYMDDGYLIHPSKEYLRHCLECIQKICGELGIVLNEKKTHIVSLKRGFTFLKCRFYLTESGKVIKKIYKRSVTKMRRKLKAFRRLVDKGSMTMQDVQQAYQSWRSYAMHFNAWHTVKNMDNLYRTLFTRKDGTYVRILSC